VSGFCGSSHDETIYERLRSLANGASSGPWVREIDGGGHAFLNEKTISWVEHEDGTVITIIPNHLNALADAAYLAAVDPQTVLALLDEIEACTCGTAIPCGEANLKEGSSAQNAVQEIDTPREAALRRSARAGWESARALAIAGLHRATERAADEALEALDAGAL
jgi:hypothetical protein